APPTAGALALSFFSQSSATHLPPHSFPTRRSSDLSPDALASVGRRGRRRFADGARRARRRFWPTPTRDLRPRPGPRGPDPTCSRSEGTRLNSSHRTISYAVFCLKKKNTWTRQLGCQ